MIIYRALSECVSYFKSFSFQIIIASIIDSMNDRSVFDQSFQTLINDKDVLIERISI